MKRINLVLNEELLEQLLVLSGSKNYSAAVNEAIAEYCRVKKLSKIFDYQGSNIWEGSLSEMRQDTANKSKKNIKIK